MPVRRAPFRWAADRFSRMPSVPFFGTLLKPTETSLQESNDIRTFE
jgi:hypothetical protein